MWNSVVLKYVVTLPVVNLQLKCLHMQSHSSDNHSMKAVHLYNSIEFRVVKSHDALKLYLFNLNQFFAI